MMLPSPQQLRYLASLADTRHFGRAATACGVTQSTLSAGILALERQLDVALLDREAGRRPVFTPIGRAVVERARTALAALEAVSEAATATSEPMSGTLRLGIIPTVAPFLLPHLLPALHKGFPRLRLQLNEDVTERLLGRLSLGLLDLLVVALPCDCDGLETRPLARDPLLAALPPGHALSRGPLHLEDLQQETMLLLEDGHCLRDHVLDACRQAGAWRDDDNQSTFAATSLQTLVQMVENGFGVTLLPRLAVKAGIAQGDRVSIRALAGEPVHRTIGLAWRPRSPREQEFRLLAGLLEQCLAQ